MTDSLRIDKWLWFCRFAKSRSLAANWVAEGEIWLNGRQIDKAAQGVRAGDEVELPMGPKLRRRVRVIALGERRGPAPEAQALYQELQVLKPALE